MPEPVGIGGVPQELLAQHEPSLLRYAFRLTGDAELAREVVQDVFAKLISKTHAAPAAEAGRNGTVAWLYAVCRNRAIDVRRKERRMRIATIDELDTRPAGGPTAASPLEVADASARVRGLLERLPERQQEVVRLK